MVWKRRPEILLCPNIPKPMHGVAPRVVLGQSWWDKERRKAYRSTNYRCQACGVHKDRAKSRQWMEGHELYDIDYPAGRMTYVETVPLCHFCHNYIHDGRLKWLLQSGKVHHAKYVAIIQHGDAVLAEAGLNRRKFIDDLLRKIETTGVAAWNDWRLVVDGVEYPPLYKSYEHWMEAMS